MYHNHYQSIRVFTSLDSLLGIFLANTKFSQGNNNLDEFQLDKTNTVKLREYIERERTIFWPVIR